jgi:murein L,D-transpeptidase YcbB/YkuD
VVQGWDGGRIGSPSAGDLDRVESGDYRIRQRPGRGNALGQVKFMFPNQFNIYLHDTPEEHLFERAERAYSHGCIRVEKPVELAKYVFAGSMDESEIRSRMEGTEEETVPLSRKLPVYILYWTAFVDEGAVHFRGDLYGQDAALDSALANTLPAAPGGEACATIRSAAGMADS